MDHKFNRKIKKIFQNYLDGVLRESINEYSNAFLSEHSLLITYSGAVIYKRKGCFREFNGDIRADFKMVSGF